MKDFTIYTLIIIMQLFVYAVALKMNNDRMVDMVVGQNVRIKALEQTIVDAKERLLLIEARDEAKKEYNEYRKNK